MTNVNHWYKHKVICKYCHELKECRRFSSWGAWGKKNLEYVCRDCNKIIRNTICNSLAKKLNKELLNYKVKA